MVATDSTPAAAASEVDSPPEVVRVVVLSDIHATSEADPLTHVAEATRGSDRNALTAAGLLLAEHPGRADLLLCPGDLVHRGDTGPMAWVWGELHAIAARLGAVVVGSVGNHDLLQAPTGGQEPQDDLRRLSPTFPYDDQTCVRTYWSDSFGVVESARWRVISLNSCYAHRGFDQDENKRGALKDQCLPGIGEYLQSAPSHPPVNICMCHHHPQEWSHGGRRPAYHLSGGDRLIELLDSREERWMLLHGHTHHPALGYFGHSSHGPVRLAAGSVGINLLPETGTRVRNQMHVIEFSMSAGSSLGLPLVGEVNSFTWQGGWAPATAGAGLPARVGFGYRRDGQDLARELAGRAATAGSRRVYSWNAIVEQLEPRARYLTPADREELLRAIVRLGGGVVRDEGGESEDFLEVSFR